MVFSSSVFFLAFLPAVLTIYFVLPSKYLKARNFVLVISSLIFYGWGEPKYIFVMLASVFFNFFLGLFIGSDKKMGLLQYKKLLLFICLSGNLVLLGFFKYTDFIISTINDISGGGIGLLNIALPIGISFYTFQTMSYILDVYWGKVPPQKSLLVFTAYVTLFPQLIAGPIVRYADVDAMLVGRTTNVEQIAQGIRRFIIGFGKKVLLANQIAVVWSDISQVEVENLSFAMAWLGAIAFSFQIYFDFSGYSDMAIGLGKIFGFDYLENFNYPYISKSITEFWRRWHISLSSWFKEYVYIPLGGNRKGLPRQIINIGIVWGLTGLWHGASWNFVVWGIYFGMILIFEKLCFLRLLEKCPSVFGHFYSLLLIVFGWMIFAMPDFEQMIGYLRILLGWNQVFFDSNFCYYMMTRGGLLCVCAIGSTPLVKLMAEKLCKRMSQHEILLGGMESIVLIGIFGLSVAFLVSGTYNPFIYFRF